jgi:hypothetical protein
MTLHVLGGLSSGARRRILILVAMAATLLLVAVGASLFLVGRPGATPTVAYYLDRDCDMVADLRWSSRYVTIPFFRLKASNFSGTVYVWRNGRWEADPSFLKRLRWSREHGYRVVAKVPMRNGKPVYRGR